MSRTLNILITAGPTHEPIDPVRYLANRSSGKLGFALAHAAAAAGHTVTLLLGPVPNVPDNLPGRVERYTTVDDLGALLDAHFQNCDVLVMAAAVADYRLVGPSPTKLPRDGGALTLELEPTPDLVARCAASKREAQRIVGFALEDFELLERSAGEKLKRKQLDAIVANPLGTMDADTIGATLRLADGRELRPAGDGPIPKPAFAAWLIDEGIGSVLAL